MKRPTSKSIQELKLVDLKVVLRKRKLRVSGKKKRLTKIINRKYTPSNTSYYKKYYNLKKKPKIKKRIKEGKEN